MIVEHTFVTTLEADEAFAKARSMLVGLGFQQVPSTPGTLELMRGTPKQPDACESIQQVQLTFDRGRIDAAVSISRIIARKSFQISRRTGKDLKPNSADARPYELLLTALAQALEDLLAKGVPQVKANAAWVKQEQVMIENISHARSMVWYRWLIIIFSIILLVVLTIAICFAATMWHLR